jgi:Meiotically Up-regulated Gene 113 (MUG113) protein/C2H2 type zinc finger protein
MIFKCDKCDKEFKFKSKINEHLNRKISCNRIIECQYCKKEFKTLHLLKQHTNKKNKCINIKDNKYIINQNNIISNSNKIKPGFIYIASNICYEIQQIFKIGRTSDIKTRINGYNTGRLTKDKFQYIYYINTDYPIELEKIIFYNLKNFNLNGELYKIELFRLKKHINILHKDLINYYNIKSILT